MEGPNGLRPPGALVWQNAIGGEVLYVLWALVLLKRRRANGQKVTMRYVKSGRNNGSWLRVPVKRCCELWERGMLQYLVLGDLTRLSILQLEIPQSKEKLARFAGCSHFILSSIVRTTVPATNWSTYVSSVPNFNQMLCVHRDTSYKLHHTEKQPLKCVMFYMPRPVSTKSITQQQACMFCFVFPHKLCVFLFFIQLLCCLSYQKIK